MCLGTFIPMIPVQQAAQRVNGRHPALASEGRNDGYPSITPTLQPTKGQFDPVGANNNICQIHWPANHFTEITSAGQGRQACYCRWDIFPGCARDILRCCP